MSALTRLTLADFRSYPALDIAIDAQMVALIGDNGAGKTNLLEAISLLSPGRGLRRADTADMARADGSGGFTVAATLATAGLATAGLATTGLATPDGDVRLGLSLSEPDRDGRRSRTQRIDGANAPTLAAFAEYVRVVWLTPEQDGLFRASAGERRRFLDRLVLAIDADHGTRVNALEKALRDRNRLLEESPNETTWLDALERQAAAVGIAIAAARAEAVTRLNTLIGETRDETSPFPWAMLALEGEIDALIAGLPALDAEEAYRKRLRDNRARDRAAGRTLAGPQASDLLVRHGPKDMAADLGSTGEQKALLVGLVLAHARLVRAMSGIPPIVLLDEVAAHLDPRRRAALYTTLRELGAQVWMSGADAGLFDDMPAGASRLLVAGGRVTPLRG